MTDSRMEKWITKEIDLAHRHEELLLRREALLQGTESYYDAQERRSASFIASFAMAEERNRELLQDLDECVSDLKRDTTDPGTPKFNTLKHNYWMMLRNVYPVWQEELREYERRHQTPSAPPPPGHPSGLSPRPPPGSPPQGRTPRTSSRQTSPVTSPMTSPTGTLTQPMRTASPNGRPPSPGRKSTAKAKAKPAKAKKSSKSSKSSKSRTSRE